MYELTIEWLDMGIRKRYSGLKEAVVAARRIIASNEPPLSAKVTRNGKVRWEFDEKEGGKT